MDFASIPYRTAQAMPVAKLEFDPENPRLTADLEVDPTSDVDVVRFMDRWADLGELLQSISTSGYVDVEPLIVMSIETQAASRMIVLEGNRRLAALKVLRDPKLAAAAEITVPDMAAELRPSLETVTVYRVAVRGDARDFIGFKHINGPHRWDSLAKAQFAANWFKDGQSAGVTLRDIARRMGDRHDTIQRMVGALFVLEQASETKAYSLEDRFPGRPFAFSHLYTALTRPGYRQFLGLGEGWRSDDPSPNPVPAERLPELRRVMLWLFGSQEEDVKPVVTSQNPHIKQLGEVLANPKARTMMMATNNLSVAYAEVAAPISQLEKSLVDLHQATENVLKKVSAYDGSDESLMQLALEAESNASVISLSMRDRRSKFLAR